MLLYLPGQTELRRYAQDSSILSTLNEELPPTRLIDTLAQIDPFAVLAGPAAGVDRPIRPSSTRPASTAPRSASCA